ncbi:MAG: magnesium transporter [Alphaproteobacteria bacterium]|nr:magnesium transporter [Alphaproteobacteria bacterium]
MTMDDQPAREEAPAPAAPSDDPAFLARVIGAAGDRDAPLLRRMLGSLDPADIADVIEHLPGEAMRHVLRLVGSSLPPEWLANLDWERREDVLPLLPADYLGQALNELDTDDAAAVAADIERDRLDEVLAEAPADVRLAVEEALSFDEETAGRLMQREYVAAPEGANVGHVIDRMRADRAELPDDFFEIYVVDPRMRPIGAVPVSKLLRHGRETALAEIMKPPLALIRPEMDQEEVAQTFRKYHLASAPVVDEAGKLTGMVTVDDIVEVIQEEGGEDLLRLSGVSDASQSDTVARSVLARAPWILVNLATALVASSVISAFSGSIEQLVALAVLMPIVASMGGNAGTQALAVAIRAISNKELTAGNAPRYVLREAMTGLSNGVLFAAVLALVAGVWFQSAGLALAIALAVLINFTCAGLAGILVPLALRRAGADPAVSSSVFVTFVTDVIGFLSFLGLATLFLLS